MTAIEKNVTELKIARALKAYLKTIAHLPEATQLRRIARREQALRQEAALVIERGLRRDGVDVGYGIRDRLR